MADGFSVQLMKDLINAAFGLTAYTGPATVYLAALTTMPTDRAGTGLAEVASANGYQRLAVTNNGTNFAAASGTTGVTKTTAATQTFAAATGGAASWGTIVGIGISKVATVGDNTATNWLGFATLTVNQTIGGGDTLSLASGNLTLKQDGG